MMLLVRMGCRFKMSMVLRLSTCPKPAAADPSIRCNRSIFKRVAIKRTTRKTEVALKFQLQLACVTNRYFLHDSVGFICCILQPVASFLYTFLQWVDRLSSNYIEEFQVVLGSNHHYQARLSFSCVI